MTQSNQAHRAGGTLAALPPRISTGVPGLDEVLGGGLPAGRLYLLEGTPGTGKTTLALQFLLSGAARGERCLYVTLSETKPELRSAAASHGWSLDALSIMELVTEEILAPDAEQTILHPAEVELGETTQRIMQEVESSHPQLVVFDSLSEMRMLAQNALRYRRQILALKHFFATSGCTVLMLDDKTAEEGDLQLHSIAHGVIHLDQITKQYGSEKRQVRVVKMRGVRFHGGDHDFNLDTGGLVVFPRLVAAQHRIEFDRVPVSTGCVGLDELLGGGLSPGSNMLFNGPSGVGKTTTAVACVIAAMKRGQRAAFYLFDEGLGTLMLRSRALDLDLAPYVESGQLDIQTIDPAALSPGQFARLVRDSVETHGAKMVVIDSLNAYLQAMPGAKFLVLQMHELLNYLNNQGVTTLLVYGQLGLWGEAPQELDLSYLTDGIVLFRFFESRGRLLKLLSVVKSRTTAHEMTIRQFDIGADGIRVGEALTDFEGVMRGIPTYRGRGALMSESQSIPA